MQALTAVVENRDFAASTKAGIDRQYAFFLERRLEQKASQVSGEYTNRVFFCLVRDLASDFAFYTRVDQAVERILNAVVQEFSMDMAGEVILA